MKTEIVPSAWDRTMVKNALIYAYKVMRTQPGPKRPRGHQAFWPDYALDYPRDRQNRSLIHPKPHEIAEADAVLIGRGDIPSWVQFIEEWDPEQARVLITWAIWMSHDGFLGGERVTEAEFAKKKLGMPLATFKRRRDLAAVTMAIWLQRQKIAPWEAPKPRGEAPGTRRSPRFHRPEKAASCSLSELRQTLQAKRKIAVPQN